MNIVIVGCGKIGFPLMVQAASKGNHVTGVDISEEVVEAINNGVCAINEPDVARLFDEIRRDGRISATTNLAEAVAKAKAVIVIVPVLLDEHRTAEMSSIISTTNTIAKNIKKGAIVSFETTVPVGSTRNIFTPIFANNGLIPDKDIYIVYSPERVKSLRVIEKFREVPKIVGGIGERSLQKGKELYTNILDAPIIEMDDLESAEFAKIIDMVYRDVNIGLVNELSVYAETLGLDINKIIPAVNTHEEAHLHMPGIGVGGHCTPVYPYFLIHDAKSRNAPQTLAKGARDINDYQAEHAVSRIEKELGDLANKKLLLLGLAFRPFVKEDIFSPAYLIYNAASKRNAQTLLNDPLYTREEIEAKGFQYSEIYATETIDAVIIITGHDIYKTIDWGKMRGELGVKLVFDGRYIIPRKDVEEAGLKYMGIGVS